MSAARAIAKLKRWSVGPGDGRLWRTRAIVFAATLSLATVVLILVGYIAIREWRKGTALLLERRQAEMLVTATVALNRDMRGAWTTVLAPMSPELVGDDPPFRMMRVTALAFARFPYPDAFIVSKRTAAGESTYVLSRSDRRPSWETGRQPSDSGPVVLDHDPPALAAVVAAARQSGVGGSFLSFATSISGTPYLVIGHLLGAAQPPCDSPTLVAFTVNVDWVRTHYFRPLLEQVARIGQVAPTVTLTVSDRAGQVVATTGERRASAATRQRTFPLLFIDPAALSLSAAQRLNVEDWTIEVDAHPSDASTQAATFWLLVVMALAGTVSASALVMTVAAVRANVQLASMKSDFVAAVTHELKTPVALIRLVGDTLATRRYSSPGTVDDYARLLSRESSRLSRTIDNLLTYSRYTDLPAATLATAAPVQIEDVIEEALEPFRPILAERDVTLSVAIAESLPTVLGDRQALVQVIETLVDNAIKYSPTHSTLRISARSRASQVHIEIADEGIGVPEVDIDRVFDRFYRGTNATQSGSGLGLAIAKRIVVSHRGSIRLRSVVNEGTTVEVVLPAGAVG